MRAVVATTLSILIPGYAIAGEARSHDGGFFLRVLGIARRSGRVGKRDDRVAVLTRVEGELRAFQVAALPAVVERMSQHVPPVGDLGEAVEERQGVPFSRATPPPDSTGRA